MKKLRICFTTNSSPWSKFHGGGQIFVHNVAEQLSRRGHHVTVLYAGPGIAAGDTKPECGYHVEWTPYIGYPWTPKLRQLNAITVYTKLKRLVKKDGFDIIDSVGSESLFVPKICGAYHIPFVVSIEHPALYLILPALTLSRPVQSFFSLIQTRELKLLKKICRYADGIVTPSNFSKSQAVKYFGADQSKIRVIYHGINEEMLRSIPEVESHDVKGDLLFFGRLEPQKGIDLLIDAYGKLVGNKVVLNQRLVIIGSGPDEDLYRKRSQDLGLSNRIVFLGWQSADTINERLKEVSLCVLPSRSESFGLTMAETLSQGVPLITTDAGSIPEVVDREKGAWLARSDDSESLYMAIRSAVEDYKESLNRARYGQSYVRENFSWQKAAEEYERFYQDLIA